MPTREQAGRTHIPIGVLPDRRCAGSTPCSDPQTMHGRPATAVLWLSVAVMDGVRWSGVVRRNGCWRAAMRADEAGCASSLLLSSCGAAGFARGTCVALPCRASRSGLEIGPELPRRAHRSRARATRQRATDLRDARPSGVDRERACRARDDPERPEPDASRRHAAGLAACGIPGGAPRPAQARHGARARRVTGARGDPRHSRASGGVDCWGQRDGSEAVAIRSLIVEVSAGG